MSSTRLKQTRDRYKPTTSWSPRDLSNLRSSQRWRKDLDDDVLQIHSIDYRRLDSIPSGRVLVVGAANTGCQIALELSTTHEVEISAGQHLPTIPQRPMGRDVWWWATLVGLTRITFGSRLGKRLSRRDQVIGGGLRELRRNGVVVRPRVSGVAGRSVAFADGTSSEYDAVLWATGFRTDHSWIEIPQIKDAQGDIEHERGVTAASGLYVLGLTWQHTRTSALLGWVTNDAEFLAEHIGRDQPPPSYLPRWALDHCNHH
jgi:putative flavoprotein involved in K+ transport